MVLHGRALALALASLACLAVPACVGDEPPVPATGDGGGADGNGFDSTGSSSGSSSGGSSGSGSGSSSGSGGSSGSSSGSGGSSGSGSGSSSGSSSSGGDGGHDGKADGGDGSTCHTDAGYAVCSGSCVDLQTSGTNCGACSHDCLGGTCKAGVCQPVVLSKLSVAGATFGQVRSDGTHVAWSQTGPFSSGGGVYSVKVAGGAGQTPVTLAAQNDTYDGVAGIALFPGVVYFLDYTSKSSFDTLNKATLGQANSASNVTSFLNGTVPRAIGSDAAGTTLTCAISNGTTNYIFYCPSGSGCMQLATGTTSFPVGGITSDGTDAYWTNETGEVVFAPQASGATVTPIAMSQATPTAIVYSAQHVYWTANGNGSIWSSPVPSPAPTSLPHMGSSAIGGFAVVGSSIYYSLQGLADIYQMPLAGSASPKVLAKTSTKVADLAVDAKALYWLDQSAGDVYALALP